MFVIIFTIKSRFFFRVNSYNFGQNIYISYILLFLSKEIIKAIYVIFLVAIKDLIRHLCNLNLLFIISQFNLSLEAKMRRRESKNSVHYKTRNKNLFYKGTCLSWKNLDRKLPSTLKSSYYNYQKTSF